MRFLIRNFIIFIITIAIDDLKEIIRDALNNKSKWTDY
jgi:hypothetical protein